MGLKPPAKISGNAVARVAPSYMGIGPVPAMKKALQKLGLDAACEKVDRS